MLRVPGAHAHLEDGIPVRGIDSHGPRQAIVQCCRDLGIDVTAEGVETPAEYRFLRRLGIEIFQGYLLPEASL